MFSIKKVLKDSYRFYLTKFITVVGITAIVYFLGALFNNISESFISLSLVLGIIVSIFLGIISVVIEIGYLKYFLKLSSGGFPDIEDLLKYTHIFWKYIFTSILLALIVSGGLVLLVVPGIYLALRFMFVPIIVVDREVTIKEAFKRSAELTKGVKWRLLGFVLILGLIQLAMSLLFFSHSGPIIYGAGFVLISPFLIISFIKTYRVLQGLDS